MMMMIDTRRPGPKALPLPELLDLRAALPLHQALLERRGGDLEVDASDVRRVGALCVQVLLSAVSTWKADTRQLVILNPSPAFVEGLNRLGVDQGT